MQGTRSFLSPLFGTWLIRLNIAMLLILVVGFVSSAQDKAPLTLEQLFQLVHLAPDEAIAREIQNRSLAFVPTQETLNQLQAQRAGPKTLAAVELLIPSPAKKQPGRTGTVERYIVAFQQRDFRTVVDLTAWYQMEIEGIKQQNPKVLWPKLIDEYYSRRIADFSQQTNVIRDIQESAAAWGGDPTAAIRATPNILRPSAKWSIVEWRSQQRSSPDGREFRLDTAYVSVEYPSHESAPQIEGQFLRRTMLEFTIEPVSQLVLSISTVMAANEYWEKLPFRIIHVRWSANNLTGLNLSIETIGGQPPYRSRSRCGRWTLEEFQRELDTGSEQKHWTVHVSRTIGDEYFPLRCTVEAADSTGQKDVVAFTVPKWFTGLMAWFCWTRKPYSLDRGNGCIAPRMELEEASKGPPQPASIPTPEPPRHAGGSRRDSDIVIRIGPEPLEPPPVATSTPPESGGQERATPPQVEEQPPAPSQPKEPLHFNVRHRHRWGLDQNWNTVDTYCEGILSVWPEGHVQYICKTPDNRNRCEKGKFPAIKEVKLDGDHLRVSLLQGGNWDFFGDPEDMRQAFEAIAPIKATPKKN